MNWYYVDGGQQAGPVDDSLLISLVNSGTIQPDTLVWHEGMAAWTPYREVVPVRVGDVGVPPKPGGEAPGGLICSECGRAFGPDEVIRHGDRWVCAACKPIFLQRLREGVASGGPRAAGTVGEAELLARDYDVDVGGYISQAWMLFKANAGIMIGASLLVFLALMGTRFIPFVGSIVYIILNGPLMGGVWHFYIKKVRGQDATIGDAFSGFGPRFSQLVLTQLVPTLIVIGMVAIVVIPLIPTIIASSRSGSAMRSSGIPPTLLVPLIVVGILFWLVMIYINTCWMFALPLVADKGLKFWPALQLSRRVVNKHWWMTFWLLFVCGWLGILGVVACCVGIVVTGPIAFASIVAHYEKVFGDLTPAQ